MPDTGHLATLGLGTSTFSVSLTSIGGFSMERPVIDTSHLGTTNYRSKIPGDLVDVGSFDITGFFLCGTTAPVTADAETITITLPELTALGDPPTIAGSGFFTAFNTAEFVTDQLQMFTATIQWATAPTFTAETDA